MQNKRKIQREIQKMITENENFVIERWRTKYRFGEITIKMHEGEPQYITKIVLNDRPPKDGKI